MKSLSIRLIGTKSEKKNMSFIIEHDFRMFENIPKPGYIDYDKSHQNVILYAHPKMPKERKNIKVFLNEIEEENKKLFLELKQKGKIQKNQGYKIKEPVVAGILTLSREAQKDMQDEEKKKIFLEKAQEYLLELCNALGSDLIYAVAHQDETALHIHFMLRNLRYKKSGNFYGINTNEEAVGKSLTNTFFTQYNTVVKNVRPHMINFTKIQDTLNFFNCIGYGRGIKREEKEKEYTQKDYIHRTVKELHEDLPMELERKKQETLEKYKEWKQKYIEEYRKLEKEKEELKKSINEYQNQLLLLNEEIKKKQELIRDAENIANQKIANAEAIAQQKIKEINQAINKTNEMIQNALNQANQEINEANKIVEEKKQELEQIEINIEKKKKEQKTTELELMEKKKELENIEKIKEERERNLEKITTTIEEKEKQLSEITIKIEKKLQKLSEIENRLKNLTDDYNTLNGKYINKKYEYQVLAKQYKLTYEIIGEIREQAEREVEKQTQQQTQQQTWRMDR